MASWGGKSFSRLRETMPPPAAQAATRSRPLLPRRSTWGCPAGREFRAPSGGSDDLASRTGLPLAGSGRCVAGAPWWLLAGPVQALGGQAGVAGVRVHPPATPTVLCSASSNYSASACLLLPVQLTAGGSGMPVPGSNPYEADEDSHCRNAAGPSPAVSASWVGAGRPICWCSAEAHHWRRPIVDVVAVLSSESSVPGARGVLSPSLGLLQCPFSAVP